MPRSPSGAAEQLLGARGRRIQMGGADAGAGCRAVLPPSCSMAVPLVQLALDQGAIQGCGDADEALHEGHHVAIGDHLQLLYQGRLVEPVLTKEVHSGPQSQLHLPPVVAGHCPELFLQAEEQGCEVFRMLFEKCSPDLGGEAVLRWNEHRLCRPLLVLQAII